MKKLLVWDGDNTLWDGTILEDSLENITLPDGRAALCEDLCKRGVIQSIASRNLPEDVEAALHKFGLGSYFMYPQADMNVHKSSMIAHVVSKLGLSRYSDVVFVDDDHYQLEEVGAAWPEVITVHPDDIDRVVGQYFTKGGGYTKEDGLRVAMYRSEQVREESGRAYGKDRQAFLHSCEMRVQVSRTELLDMPRVIDLVARANRLSAAVCAPTVYDLERWRVDGSLRIMRAEDKFGSYGISGAVNMYRGLINLLVISCRLQGKGFGSTLLGYAINRSLTWGNRPTAIWMETKYNAGVRALYEWYGFAFEEYANDIVVARYADGIPAKLPGWIEVI